jgi:hypothetical protein
MKELAREMGGHRAADPSLDEGGGPVVEVPLLMSLEQMAALERAAHRRGLTAAEMVRRLLGDFIAANRAFTCRAS